jgi:hypothetical protein
MSRSSCAPRMLSLRDKEHLKSSVADAIRRSVVTRNCLSKIMWTLEVEAAPPRSSKLTREASDNQDNRRGFQGNSCTPSWDLVSRSPACSISQLNLIFRRPARFVLNLIGHNGSLEQPAPSPLQVTMFFNGILEGAGHGSLRVSAIHFGRGRLTVHFPDSLSGDAVTTGMGGRGASPITTGGSGRSRSGIRLRAENTSFS